MGKPVEFLALPKLVVLFEFTCAAVDMGSSIWVRHLRQREQLRSRLTPIGFNQTSAIEAAKLQQFVTINQITCRTSLHGSPLY
jgi:Fe2+ transport system protein FeoA